MRPARQTVAAIALLATGVLAGCGGESASDESSQAGEREEMAATTVAAAFAGQDPSAFEEESSRCIGTALVEALGIDALVDAGLLGEDLGAPAEPPSRIPRDVAGQYADAIIGCQDVAAEIADRRENYPDATDEAVAGYVECIEEIDPALLREAVVESSVAGGDPAKAQPYFDATATCEELLGPPTAAG